MRKHFFTPFFSSLFFLVCFCNVSAQFSGVKWEKSLFYETPTGGYYSRDPTIKKVIRTNKNETYIVWQLSGNFLPVSHFAYVQKVNTNGEQLWETELEAGGFYVPSFCDALLTGDGGIVVLSMTDSGDFGYDSSHTGGSAGDANNGILFKISVNGNLEWKRYIKGKRREHITSLDIDRYNNILVSGSTWSAYDDFAGRRRYVDSSYLSEALSQRYYYYQNNNDAFIAKFSPSGELLNLRCYGGSLSDGLIHVQDHPVYGYVAIGYSESKDYDLPSQGTKNGIWMLRLDTTLNIVQQKILDSSDTFFSRFFIKNKRMFLSNSTTFRELGFDGHIVREHAINNVVFDQHSYFDQSGYVFSPVQNKKIHVYDSSLQLAHTLQIPGVEHGYFSIDGTSRNNIYLIGKATLNHTYVHGGYISYQVHSNAVLNFGDSYNYITGKIFADATVTINMKLVKRLSTV